MPTGAPTATAAVAPAGIKMDDGFPTKITLARDTDISLWEKTVTPPGIDGEDKIDTTTMWNTTWRTFSPRALRTMTPMTTTVAYDPDLYDEIREVINQDDVITVTFPDGSTLAFHGFVRAFEPDEMVEGTQPTATVTIEPTNQDSVGAEYGAVMTEVLGT